MESFFTKDIYLASTLIASGLDLQDITRNDKQCVFLFADSENLKIVVENYWADTLEISAKSLFNAFKELKSRMYNEL